MGVKSLTQRLKDGEFIICAEGYVFELERRGYLCAGPWVPEVIIEHPHLVKNLYEEFVHAGSDVVEALTYYGHREKLRIIGRENDLEKLNRGALKLAREVANKTGTLMAGNICNTTCYQPDDKESCERVRNIFKESIQWAVEEGADFIIAETFSDCGEALLAVEAIKKYAPGKESVITLAQNRFESRTSYGTRDGYTFPQAIKKLYEAGATVVGLNCMSGPKVMADMLRDIRKECPTQPLAALPVPYRTHWDCETMVQLVVQETGQRAFPYNLDSFLCTLDDVEAFGKVCKELNIQYTGLCCGNSAKFTRILAETLGHKPAASRYSPQMDLHTMFGTSKTLHQYNLKLKDQIDSKAKPTDKHLVKK